MKLTINNEKITEFWDHRHKFTNEWQSGGDKSISILQNKGFYLHRLGLLLGIIDTYCKEGTLDILDAGCGKGWLSDQLCALEHRVVGIDASQTAIDICQRHRRGNYYLSNLAEYSSCYFFDLVVSMDVMFHILDDKEWEASITNLASLVRYGGILVLVDDPVTISYKLGDYIIHRNITLYSEILFRLGYTLLEKVPYRNANNPNQFLIFCREEIST